jgi:hypothetical protein
MKQDQEGWNQDGPDHQRVEQHADRQGEAKLLHGEDGPGQAKPPPAGPAIPSIYDSGRRTWWTQNGRGTWIDVTETSVRRLLKLQGFPETGRGELLSPSTPGLSTCSATMTWPSPDPWPAGRAACMTSRAEGFW